MIIKMAILVLGAYIAALVSGAAGFGGSLLLLPIVSCCIGPEYAVPVLTISQLMGNISRVYFGRKVIAWKPVLCFCITALPLAALGAFGFSVFPKGIVTRILGAAIIILVLLKLFMKKELPNNRNTFLFGGALTGLLSGLAGSGGPIGAAVFLSLDLPPVAYIASEAVTATAMHVLKTVIYAKFAGLTMVLAGTGCLMGLAMIAGTFSANRFIKKIEKNRFRKYVAVLLGIVGAYMLLFGNG